MLPPRAPMHLLPGAALPGTVPACFDCHARNWCVRNGRQSATDHVGSAPGLKHRRRCCLSGAIPGRQRAARERPKYYRFRYRQVHSFDTAPAPRARARTRYLHTAIGTRRPARWRVVRRRAPPGRYPLDTTLHVVASTLEFYLKVCDSIKYVRCLAGTNRTRGS